MCVRAVAFSMSSTTELKNSIQMKLEQTGEYDRCVLRPTLPRALDAGPPVGTSLTRSRALRRLKEHLRARLIDCGWRDKLKEHTMGACARNPRPAARAPVARVVL